MSANLVSVACAPFYDALDLVGDGVLFLDAARRVEHCNAAFAKRAIVDAGEVVGERLEALYTARHLGSELGAQIDDVLAAGTAGRHYLRCRDGSEVAIECRLRPAGGWILVAGEVSERGLTGRSRLIEFLETVIGAGREVAVLYLDLDRFKIVNDTLGHDAGDALLQTVVGRIRSAIGTSDRFVRLGGDEFGIAHTGGIESAEVLASNLIELVGRPCLVCGHIAQVGLSVGVAVAPADGTDPAQLLRSADLALYAAKTGGRNRFHRFEVAMDRALAERRALEFELRKAEKLRQFRLHYQPQSDAATGRVTSCEALIYWQHPTRGLVPQSEFLGLAESIGLTDAIGQWVFKTACREASSWPAEVGVAVNVSAVQFASGKLIAQVRAALDEAGLEPHRLEIEITESVLLTDSEANFATLHGLRKLGVHIAMDNFGTGYSSLSYLTHFPFDKIKVSESFAQRLDKDKTSEAIACAVAELGQRLGITTIAEGVETQEQLDDARSRGFTAIQGFHFSQPLTAERLAAALSSWSYSGLTAVTSREAA